MFRFSFAAAAAALLAAQAFAQTTSECNPTWGNVTCPDNAALGTTFDYPFNDTMAEMDPRFFNVTAGASLIKFSQDGAEFTMVKHGDSVRVQSDFYIFYGRVEAIMQAAPGTGVISSVNLLSDDLDEIDWEVMGQNTTNVFNNWYGKGNRTQNHGEEPVLADSQTGFHNYTIIWTEQELEFWLDGQQVRTVPAGEPGNYPQTPCYINLSLWAGGDPDNEPGVIAWAGGETDYDAGPYTMKIKSLKVVDGHTNSSSYHYSDTSGSHASIQVNEGESEVYKALNKKSTKQKAEEKWTGLSQTAKIAIAASVCGVLLLVCVIYTFVCITQRKKGRLEREAHDKEWAAHESELAAYRLKMARGDFAVSHLGHGEAKF
ncbi:hypothetical protein WHR41_07855 [Cladosporium halotolerans]|uniref:chitinase n=1 Tax=Cladosporium halotolerans TaxID=1052096 RepID=A0AB34KGY2_9PEZI